MTNSKTASNSTPGRPFVKGDARINRKGRPRKIDDYRALVQSILNEAATDKAGNALTANGHAMTVIEAMTRQMIQSKNPRMAQIILEYAYGKVPAPVELSGPDGGPVLVERVEVIAPTDDATPQ
jgi:hypothetical protein